MIRLAYPLFEGVIEFKENIVNVLILESPKCFREFIYEMRELINKSYSKICVSDDYEQINVDKIFHVVFSLEHLEINSKKILGKIISDLKTYAYSDSMYEKTMNIISQMCNYMEDLLQCSDIDLAYDDMEIDACLKEMNIKIEVDSKDFLQLLCDYVDVVSEVFNLKIFVFFHLKSYLEEEEIVGFYKHCHYRKIKLLICENTFKKKLNFEKLTIIDEDLCQIS